MQFLLLVSAVLISIAAALASAEALLSLMFHLMSKKLRQEPEGS